MSLVNDEGKDDNEAKRRAKIDDILKARPGTDPGRLRALDFHTLSRKWTEIRRRDKEKSGKRDAPVEAKVDTKKVKALEEDEEEATRRTVARFLPRSRLAALRPSSPPPPSPPRRPPPLPPPPTEPEEPPQEEEEEEEEGERVSFLDEFFADGCVMKPISSVPKPPDAPRLVPVYRSVDEIPPPRFKSPFIPTRKGWFKKKLGELNYK